ncbi:MAG: DUF4870 domain-containing protein [Acidobacteriaceae bacterium]
MNCAKCNAAINAGDVVCANCGATVVSSSEGAAVAAVPASAGLSNNAAAALSYVTFIPAIIFLVMEPYNKVAYIRFHAFQCIGLSIAAIAAHIIAMLIPVIGWVLAPFISLAFLIIWIIAILKASKGEWFKIPLIGPFAEKQAKNG